MAIRITNKKSALSIPNSAFLKKWIEALKMVLPTYIIIHVGLIGITLFSGLFTLIEFGETSRTVDSLIKLWFRWDSGLYTYIAQHGYNGAAWRSAFFPLYPLLERILIPIFHDPFYAGLFISDVACLVMLTVLYQLTQEEFDKEIASRTILYLSLFPVAFFFLCAYTESLFICLVIMHFYALRHKKWWVAGLIGLIACLTRSAGIFLVLPFGYEYLRQAGFSLKKMLHFNIFSIALIPTGILLYCLYCYIRLGDFLAWNHAENVWHRSFNWPWITIYNTVEATKHYSGLISFSGLHNFLDLLQILFLFIMLVILTIYCGKTHKEKLCYVIYAIALFFFFLSFPVYQTPIVPLQSMPRYMLEIFPLFTMAAVQGKRQWFHNGYIIISGMLLSMASLLYLTGHWMI